MQGKWYHRGNIPMSFEHQENSLPKSVALCIGDKTIQLIPHLQTDLEDAVPVTVDDLASKLDLRSFIKPEARPIRLCLFQNNYGS